MTRADMLRPAWLIAGYGLFAVGAVGIALPLLPTTGPWILAVWCLVKGGDPLAQKLLDHPRFGRALRDWFERGALSRTGKVAASLGLASAAGLVAWAGMGGWWLAALVTLLAAVMAWLWSRPLA